MKHSICEGACLTRRRCISSGFSYRLRGLPVDFWSNGVQLPSHNRGQNSLGQMFFALKEAFPVCKLLPFTANAPLPPWQCWLLKEDILVNSSMKFSSAFNIAMGGDLNSKFPPKYKVYHEFCPRFQFSKNISSLHGHCFLDIKAMILEVHNSTVDMFKGSFKFS